MEFPDTFGFFIVHRPLYSDFCMKEFKNRTHQATNLKIKNVKVISAYKINNSHRYKSK